MLLLLLLLIYSKPAPVMFPRRAKNRETAAKLYSILGTNEKGRIFRHATWAQLSCMRMARTSKAATYYHT